jgi:hypothetical protein
MSALSSKRTPATVTGAACAAAARASPASRLAGMRGFTMVSS